MEPLHGPGVGSFFLHLDAAARGKGPAVRWPDSPGREALLEIEAIHHVSLVVADLERARRFYADVLGLREIDRPPFDFPGAWFGIGDRQLHLIVHPPARTLRGRDAPIDSRDGHLALRVAGWRDALAHLERHAVPHVAKPVNRTPWPQIFLADPDGNLIELNAERLD